MTPQELITDADGRLEKLWRDTTGLFGTGLARDVNASRVYAREAGLWLSRANIVLYKAGPSLSGQGIYLELGKRLDLTVARRAELIDLGLVLKDPVAEGIEAGAESIGSDVVGAATALSDFLVWIKANLKLLLVIGIVATAVALYRRK